MLEVILAAKNLGDVGNRINFLLECYRLPSTVKSLGGIEKVIKLLEKIKEEVEKRKNQTEQGSTNAKNELQNNQNTTPEKKSQLVNNANNKETELSITTQSLNLIKELLDELTQINEINQQQKIDENNCPSDPQMLQLIENNDALNKIIQLILSSNQRNFTNEEHIFRNHNILDKLEESTLNAILKRYQNIS